MRSFIRDICLRGLGFINKPAAGVHILNGHYISKENKNQNVLYELLKSLSQNVEYIKIEEAVALVTEKKKVKEKYIAFTFDDGFEECYTKIAPVLKEFNTNAAFFINPNFIESDEKYKRQFLSERVFVKNKNPMKWNMIKDLHQQGFVIGSHTTDHLRLNIENEKTLSEQIVVSKNIIEEKTGSICEYFAYPYGQENDISKEALTIAQNTYKYIFSGFNHKKYFSFANTVINRRHFEGDWPLLHMNYFLSFKKRYK